MRSHKRVMAAAAVITGLVGVGIALAQPPTGPMSFFVASRGSGNGGNLGGLAGADRICRTWHRQPGKGRARGAHT